MSRLFCPVCGFQDIFGCLTRRHDSSPKFKPPSVTWGWLQELQNAYFVALFLPWNLRFWELYKSPGSKATPFTFQMGERLSYNGRWLPHSGMWRKGAENHTRLCFFILLWLGFYKNMEKSYSIVFVGLCVCVCMCVLSSGYWPVHEELWSQIWFF